MTRSVGPSMSMATRCHIPPVAWCYRDSARVSLVKWPPDSDTVGSESQGRVCRCLTVRDDTWIWANVSLARSDPDRVPTSQMSRSITPEASSNPPNGRTQGLDRGFGSFWPRPSRDLRPPETIWSQSPRSKRDPWWNLLHLRGNESSPISVSSFWNSCMHCWRPLVMGRSTGRTMSRRLARAVACAVTSMSYSLQLRKPRQRLRSSLSTRKPTEARKKC